MEKKLVNEEYLTSKNFKKRERLGGFHIFGNGVLDITQIPLKKGGFTFGFAFEVMDSIKYKYPLTISDLEVLYKILTGKEL
jgi:hypothetical protein